MLTKERVRTPEQALIYLTDCHLATVSDMALKKKRPKWEFERHVMIAQTSINWIRDFKINIEVGSRAYEVLSLESQKVSEWAERFYPKN